MSERRSKRRAADDARRREMLQLPTTAAEYYVRLDAPEDTSHLVSVDPGPDGDIYAIWSTADGVEELISRTDHPSGASFANARTARPVTAVVTAHGRERRTVAVVPHLELAYPIVQPLPDGHVLLVGARARWRPEGPDKNAIVVAADGRKLRETTLGDGVKHVHTTLSGDVWVGYSDEGVFGSFGWGVPDGPTPIGRAGIACFDSELALRWEFDPPADAALDTVDDCYALNVIGDVAWSCYYGEFPIVRIDGGDIESWRNPVAGARALAVADDERVLLAGGYGADRDRLVEGRLIDGAFVVVSESRLTLPDGAELPYDIYLSGRGSDLFGIAGQHCYRLSLDDR